MSIACPRLPRATILAVAVLMSLTPVAAAQANATSPYVSLGDSYTAAPFVPNVTGNPIGCVRSTNNYPSDVARALHISSFTDVSCSGATTANMTQPQPVPFGGVNPPQFNALSAADRLVTVGIGGNDAGLVAIAEECGALDFGAPFGTRCKDHYESGGGDPNVVSILAAGPKIAAVLRGIHARAPRARVLIVGYPDGLPVDGSSCWPFVPLSAGDIRYFNALEQLLNFVIARRAARNHATFVDTWPSSIGHDACKPTGIAWLNGLFVTSPGFPLHPNQAGEQNMANQLLAALG